MSLKVFKSYTKSTRGTVLVDKKGLWKGKSLKSLTVGSHSTGGRNNLGRITSRHKGAGHKQKYRQIDFYRKKDFRDKFASEACSLQICTSYIRSGNR